MRAKKELKIIVKIQQSRVGRPDKLHLWQNSPGIVHRPFLQQILTQQLWNK